MKRTSKIILMAVIALALFLRVYKLGQYPVGFLWDEASLGYNAYSILQTGKDEYGKFFPLIFKSFGDYKPGLYVYLSVPSVFIFGLNEFSVRLPSAICGALTIFFFYLLLKETLGKSENENNLADEAKSKNLISGSEKIALISSVLLAISPWHINFSRGAWELNVMVFELIVAIYFLIKSFRTKKISLSVISALVFVLSLFTYQAAKLLMPVLIVGLIFFFRKQMKSLPKKQKVLFTSLVLSGFLFFNLLTLLGGKSGRIKVLSIFSYPRSPEETQMILAQDSGNVLNFSLFHGSPVFFLRSVLGRYFNYFSGKFLFFVGDWSNARNGTVYQGVLYFADAIFLCIGLAVLFRKKREPIENFFLFWLVVAPIPAALTRDSISSVRSFSMVIPFMFISAVGIERIFSCLKKTKKLLRLGLVGSIVIIYILCFLRFLDLYFIHDQKFNSEDRLYGYEQVVDYIKPLIGSKNKVFFSLKYGQPYIFYLFYTKYDPKKYQVQSKLTENANGDVGKVEKIDNIYFKIIYFPDDKSNKNSLFIGDEFDLPLKDVIGQENITLLKQIDFLNNKTAFRVVETK